MWASRGLLLKKSAELNTRSITLYLAERASKWTKYGLNMAICGFVPGAFKITCDYKGSDKMIRYMTPIDSSILPFNIIQRHSTSFNIQIYPNLVLSYFGHGFEWWFSIIFIREAVSQNRQSILQEQSSTTVENYTRALEGNVERTAEAGLKKMMTWKREFQVVFCFFW